MEIIIVIKIRVQGSQSVSLEERNLSNREQTMHVTLEWQATRKRVFLQQYWVKATFKKKTNTKASLTRHDVQNVLKSKQPASARATMFWKTKEFVFAYGSQLQGDLWGFLH